MRLSQLRVLSRHGEQRAGGHSLELPRRQLVLDVQQVQNLGEKSRIKEQRSAAPQKGDRPPPRSHWWRRSSLLPSALQDILAQYSTYKKAALLHTCECTMHFWAQTKSLHHCHRQRLEARAPWQRAPCAAQLVRPDNTFQHFNQIWKIQEQGGNVSHCQSSIKKHVILAQGGHAQAEATVPMLPKPEAGSKFPDVLRGAQDPPGDTPACSTPRETGTAADRQPESSQPHRIFSSPRLRLQRQHHLSQQQRARISSAQ